MSRHPAVAAVLRRLVRRCRRRGGGRTDSADLRELEVQRRRGQLLEAAAVEREWAGVLRAVRAAVLAVASRVRARLPHLTVHDAQVLDEELRAALQALAEARGDAP